MTAAHNIIACLLKEMTVWEAGRADRLLTLGVSPEEIVLRIMRERGIQMNRYQILKKLRTERDAAAARGDHAEALILSDRIGDVKAGRYLAAENAMALFESALARRRASEREPS